MLPNRGAVVRGPSAREIRESYEVRTELEGLAAELATARMGDAHLLRLRESEELFRTSVGQLVAGLRGGKDAPWDEHDAWVRANDLFHQTILDAAGNRRLTEVLGDLRRSFPRELAWSALSANSRRLEDNVLQHGAILDAIERRDAAAARQSMVAHIRTAGELVLHYFETVAEPLPDDAAAHPVIGRRPNALRRRSRRGRVRHRSSATRRPASSSASSPNATESSRRRWWR